MDGFKFRGGSDNGGDFIYQMYRRTPSGALQLFDVDFNDYVHPPRGARGKFRLNGWSPHYQTTGVYDGKETTTTRTRAEYQILKLPGNADLEGRLFSQQFPIPGSQKLGNPKSKLTQFISALLNRPIVPDEPIDIIDFIGTEFVTSVTRDENGDRIYCGIAWDVIDPTKTTLAPTVVAAAPLVAAGTDANDPFAEEDL